MELEWTVDLRVIPLPEGIVRAESEDDNAQLGNIKGVGMNLAMLPLQTLNTLHQGVSEELWIREKYALSVISEIKMKNEQIFTEKVQALKKKEELATRSIYIKIITKYPKLSWELIQEKEVSSCKKIEITIELLFVVPVYQVVLSLIFDILPFNLCFVVWSSH